MRGCSNRLLRFMGRDALSVACAAGLIGAMCVFQAIHPMDPGVVAGLAMLWPLRGLQQRAREWRDRLADQEHRRFVAAAETSLDAFCLLDAVRDKDGSISDFRIRYVNANAERMLRRSRSELLGKMLCRSFPKMATNGLFHKMRRVATTGEPLLEEREIEGN